MSIQNLNNQISGLDREINNLQTQINNLDKSITTKSKEASNYLERISREKDLRRIASLQKDYNRKQEEIQRIEKDKITKNKTLADKLKRKAELNQQLSKEEQSQREKVKREHKELLQLQERITSEIQRQKSFSQQFTSSIHQTYNEPISKQYDVFISHASEDKESFVRPLAEALTKLGVEIWYDENEIKFGNSIRKAIDKGLANSRFGLVILSKSYFIKYWTGKELDGLFSKNINDAILPVLHNISVDEVRSYSTMLSGILALNSAIYSIEEIANEVFKIVNPSK